jgi:hypothetical protein
MPKETIIAFDSKEQIMWIKGNTKDSPLTYREFNEGRDMQSSTITKDGFTFHAPFKIVTSRILKRSNPFGKRR